MSDPAHPTTPTPTPPGVKAAGEPRRNATEDLRATARETRAAASEAASTVSAEASAAAGTLKREGAALLDTAKDRAGEMAREGVEAGADRAKGLARAIHRAADDLEGESPELARTIHEAAGAVDGMARALRDRSPGDMLRGAEAFAQRQPLVFFGGAALAGFALARFARASATHHHETRHAHPTHQAAHGEIPGTPAGGGATTSPGTATAGAAGSTYPTAATPRDPATGAPRPATLASASLGGSAAYRPPSQDKV
ncbi:MAG TPA: hypothetical protein VGN83_17285 [Falsiroseomonas sp.]|nr:hypothetical protein [Falsiroseomonas sp.]